MILFLYNKYDFFNEYHMTSYLTNSNISSELIEITHLKTYTTKSRITEISGNLDNLNISIHMSPNIKKLNSIALNTSNIILQISTTDTINIDNFDFVGINSIKCVDKKIYDIFVEKMILNNKIVKIELIKSIRSKKEEIIRNIEHEIYTINSLSVIKLGIILIDTTGIILTTLKVEDLKMLFEYIATFSNATLKMFDTYDALCNEINIMIKLCS